MLHNCQGSKDHLHPNHQRSQDHPSLHHLGRLKLLALWPSGMLRPGGPPRLSYSRGNMAKSCKTWSCKSSERKADAKVTSSLLARLPYMPAQQNSKVCWWLLTNFFLGQASTSHPFTLSQRTSPAEEQSVPAAPPAPVPKQSPRPKMQHPSPDPVDSMPLGGTMSKTAPEEPSSSKGQEVPPWNRALKWSCLEAFSQDSDLVKEAREEYFLKHS